MSRRRGEFEHRTSIFEGAYRAWSHLGGIDPMDLTSTSASDLDPLTHPHSSDTDVRINGKDKDKDSNNNNNNNRSNNHKCKADMTNKKPKYPYEPLPRSGLAHPFVQEIISPWLGPEADHEVVLQGLTTLRTWWQHRRKGETPSAITALGTEKMRSVVEGYTRHFFKIAHSIVMVNGEQPPKTLGGRIKELEKNGFKLAVMKQKEKEAVHKTIPMYRDGDVRNNSNNNNSNGAGGARPGSGGGSRRGHNHHHGHNDMHTDNNNGGAENNNPNSTAMDNNNNNSHSNTHMMDHDNDPAESIMYTEEELHSNVDGNILANRSNHQRTNTTNTNNTNTMEPQSCCSGNLNTTNNTTSIPIPPPPKNYGDPNKIPVVFVSANGAIQISMTIQGITCDHCVKIIETVLKGVNGSSSPIRGIKDAAADRELSSVLILIEQSSYAKRIAYEASENLKMVGYDAQPMEMGIVDPMSGNAVDLHALRMAFDVVASTDARDVFDWSLSCTCPDNGILRKNCPRHSQMNKRIFEAFDERQGMVKEFMAGCGKRYGMACSCGVGKCKCNSGKCCGGTGVDVDVDGGVNVGVNVGVCADIDVDVDVDANQMRVDVDANMHGVGVGVDVAGVGAAGGCCGSGTGAGGHGQNKATPAPAGHHALTTLNATNIGNLNSMNHTLTNMAGMAGIGNMNTMNLSMTGMNTMNTMNGMNMNMNMNMNGGLDASSAQLPPSAFPSFAATIGTNLPMNVSGNAVPNVITSQAQNMQGNNNLGVAGGGGGAAAAAGGGGMSILPNIANAASFGANNATLQAQQQVLQAQMNLYQQQALEQMARLNAANLNGNVNVNVGGVNNGNNANVVNAANVGAVGGNGNGNGNSNRNGNSNENGNVNANMNNNNNATTNQFLNGNFMNKQQQQSLNDMMISMQSSGNMFPDMAQSNANTRGVQRFFHGK